MNSYADRVRRLCVPLLIACTIFTSRSVWAQTYESINIGAVLDAGPTGITLTDGTVVRAKVVSSGNGDPTDFAIGNNTGQIGGTFNGTTVPAYTGLTTPTLFTALINEKVNLRNGGATNYAHAIGFRVYFSRPYKLKQILVLDIDGLVGTGNNSEWTSSFAYNGDTRINPTASRHSTTQLGFDVPGTVALGWNNLVDAELGIAAEDFNGAKANPVVAFRNVDGTGNDVDPDDLPNQVLYDFGNQQATDFFIMWGILPNTSNVAPPNNRQSSGVSPLVVSPLSISGTVFNDVNGLNASPVNTVDGIEIQAASSVQLHANLFSEAGDFIATVPIDPAGNYNFANVTPSTNYQVTIGTTPAAAGSTPQSSVGLPADWVNTGETNNGLGTLSDGTVNGVTAVAVGEQDVADINFGIEQGPQTAVILQAVQANPGGTVNVNVPADAFVTSNVGTNPNTGDPAPGAVTGVAITGFPTNAVSITIDGTLYTTIGAITAAYPNGIPTDASGLPTVTISIDPGDGVDNVIIPIAAIDAAGQQDSTPGSITIPFSSPISISGTVFNDVNGLNPSPVNTVDGAVIQAASSVQLHANLFSEAGDFIATVPIDPAGNYNFTNVTPSTNYQVTIGTTPASAGSTPQSSVGLPADWVNTGETNNGLGTLSDGTVNGITAVTVGTQDVANINFGVEQGPQTAVNLQAVLTNPGGTNNVNVPGDAFVTSNVGANLNTGDPAPGAVTGVAITGFPTNAVSITIDGTLYTTIGTITAAYPDGIPTDASGLPTISIAVDPQDGVDNVIIPIAAIDAAGQQDPTPGSITIPFQALFSISGNVFNDSNGLSSPDNTVNGTPVDGTDIDAVTSGQQPLYASLILGGSVISTMPISALGAYEFTDIPAGNYAVVITTNPAGSLNSDLPSGWGYTGDHIGTNAGGDGLTDGNLVVNLIDQSVNEVNFGINQVPVAHPVDQQISQPLPGQILTLDGGTGNPPAPSGTDPEEGPLGNHTVTVTTLPNNGVLYYNGTPVQQDNPIQNFQPSLFTLELTGAGYDTTFFEYTYTDSAGLISLPTLYRLVWPTPLPVHLVSFDARKEGAVAVISWSTATEENSDRFIIEHSVNGKVWYSIGEVPAKKESSVLVHYQYVHLSPNGGQNLYRLKMIDQDGTFAYSHIKNLGFDTGLKLIAFPNPAVDRFAVDLAGVGGITNVQELTLSNLSGSLKLNIDLRTATVQTKDLPAGTYVVTVKMVNGQVLNAKVIISK
jgi:hypothetical protein